ncbi:unnamed protein product [Urochloa decumbens]|uniref:Protein kinase domain-containing protein n=1 Tax=Urochloa decumbens TaxID=240449 RepID=A0ABC9B857_9POAL
MLKPASTDSSSRQFKNEIYNLSMLKHQNIVQVLGYCYEIEKEIIEFNGGKVLVERTHRAICLEYLHNGSLQEHLSDEFGGHNWEERFIIIKGTCEGLECSHKKLQQPIYHLDLKPDNILLDKDMVPKIADFGLSRIFGKESTPDTQYPCGTLGYQPPEYIDRGEISEKFDIFSLGVIMIRIVSGPEGYSKCRDMPSDKFIDQVSANWRERLKATCSDYSLLEAYCHQVKTCTNIALKCLDEDRHKRPDIVNIIGELNEIAIDTPIPHRGCTEPTKNGQDINLRPSHSTELEVTDARETSSDIVEELIVGRTKEKITIIASLLPDTPKNIAILPIYGIGGIGKTTLARMIYNDQKFKCYSKVWVDVSQRFDMNKIHESIISHLPRKKISGEKILIVLDDLWEDNQFKLLELKDKLYDSGSNTIILVTTRIELVVERICTNIQPYKILPLTNDMSWDIIKQRSGFEARDDKEQLKGIGWEIARKCGGVALAAQSLGFTLRSLNSDQWMKVKDNYIWNEAVSNDVFSPGPVLSSLKLSYSYMSPWLKRCFIYCGTFPKGHKITKDDLVQQWISLGFIKPTKLLSSMHLCDKYIVQLLGLSFFNHSVSLKTTEEYYEKVKIFTMHDLMHDFLCSIQELPDSIGQLEQLRFLKAERIRNLPESITKLSNLIYLNLHGSSMDELPKSIGELKSLMHLDLSFCDELLQLPDSFRNLENLAYLNLSCCFNISGVTELLRSLSRLEHLNMNCCFASDLEGAFGDLTKLQYLNLSCGPRGKYVSGLSQALVNLTQLRHLNLANVRDDEGSEILLDRICNLSNLEHLDLSSNDLYSIPEDLRKLRKLHTLNLSFCRKLQRLPASVSELDSLNYLNVEGCRNLDMATIPQYRNRSIMLLPHFVVSAGDDESSSNICHLEYENPIILEITRLENVRSSHEAQKIQLAEKYKIKELQLKWTRDAKRFVHDDAEVLKQLVPPGLLEVFVLEGYNSVSFPSWMMDIATYVPYLCSIALLDLPSCKNLPPLGQLRNLKKLLIANMESLQTLNCEKLQTHSGGATREGLGDLTSLEDLWIFNCKSIKTLPESIQQLRLLEHLEIEDCPELVQWCKSEENKMKLVHINQVELDGELLSVTRSPSAMLREQSLEEDVEFREHDQGCN